MANRFTDPAASDGSDGSDVYATVSSSSSPGEFVTYADAILAALAAGDDPGRTVLTASDGRRIAAGEFREGVLRMAWDLTGRGVGRGTVVGLLTGNTAEALAGRYAANLTGACVTSLYEGMAPVTLARIVESVEAAVLLVDATRYEDAKELLPLIPGLTVLTLGPGPFGEDLQASSARYEPRPFVCPAGPEDIWSIRHTGGTTGIPKGIPMAHGPYAASLGRPVGDAGASDEPHRYLACTPLAHLAGVFTDITLRHGGSVVLQHSFDPGDVLAAIEREHITDVFVLPPLLHQLLDHPNLAATDHSGLRRIAYGGCAASPARLRQATEVFGPVLYGAYGQSEALTITVATPDDHAVTGRDGRITTGRPLPGVELAIRDAAGRTLPPGEEGEIHVRSAGMMRGYWKQPELTAEMFRDGWLRTGDVGYLDENGYLFIVDRIKDMIIVVGGHVYPAELEEVILEHPDVARCAVFGIRDDDADEQVHVAVVPVAGRRPGTDGLREFVTARKGPMYAPKAVHLVPEIPLTSVGKPDRKRLQATFSGSAD
ncbi:AMP-binding protein [Streptomyces morookaense]|uniref:AMP-binding protein n=1 Tax=Streptomyces morookaense TaxID=1970 RepID=A0A7Y7B5H7_STRMO|nr:AMP-binding protein [Streptomyces morookaense]NVK78986.1 AMP-binding protein [Streptomyces morookaense]GHF36575.1 fatty acid CoA ligase [Streptomyces morookaense]